MLTIRVITRLQDLTGDCTFTSLTIGDVVRWNGSAFVNTAQSGLTGIAHANLTGLTSGDDHTQYALLAGRSGGQTLIGGTASGNNLTLRTTSHATKGKIVFGTSAYDEVNNRLGVNIATPANSVLHVVGDSAGTIRVDGSDNATNPLAGNAARILFDNSNNTVNNLASFEYYNGAVTVMYASFGLQYVNRTGSSEVGDFYWVLRNAGAVAEVMRLQGVGTLSVKPADAVTTTITTGLILNHTSSGTPAAGFGTGITLQSKSSTTTSQDQAKITSEWVVATHASRTSRLKLLASDSAGDREGVRVESNGTVALLSFFGAAAVVQPAGVTAALATRTAGGSYGATEQTMLQEAHDMARTLAVAIRALGLAA